MRGGGGVELDDARGGAPRRHALVLVVVAHLPLDLEGGFVRECALVESGERVAELLRVEELVVPVELAPALRVDHPAHLGVLGVVVADVRQVEAVVEVTEPEDVVELGDD